MDVDAIMREAEYMDETKEAQAVASNSNINNNNNKKIKNKKDDKKKDEDTNSDHTDKEDDKKKDAKRKRKRSKSLKTESDAIATSTAAAAAAAAAAEGTVTLKYEASVADPLIAAALSLSEVDMECAPAPAPKPQPKKVKRPYKRRSIPIPHSPTRSRSLTPEPEPELFPEPEPVLPSAPEWIFSCACGQHEGVTSDSPISQHPQGEQFECDRCYSWGHLACYTRYHKPTVPMEATSTTSVDISINRTSTPPSTTEETTTDPSLLTESAFDAIMSSESAISHSLAPQSSPAPTTGPVPIPPEHMFCHRCWPLDSTDLPPSAIPRVEPEPIAIVPVRRARVTRLAAGSISRKKFQPTKKWVYSDEAYMQHHDTNTDNHNYPVETNTGDSDGDATTDAAVQETLTAYIDMEDVNMNPINNDQADGDATSTFTTTIAAPVSVELAT